MLRTVKIEKLFSIFCEDCNPRIIVLTSRGCAGDLIEFKSHDAVSSKVAGAKLASAANHASSRHLWSRGDLQRDFHAHRHVCSGFLAKAGKLGGRGGLCFYANEFGSLPLDSLGRATDVSGRYPLSNPDEVYGHQGLRSAQLAAFGADQFSTGTACDSRRHYGPGAIPDAISGNASDAAVAAVRGDCRSTMLAHPDAT